MNERLTPAEQPEVHLPGGDPAIFWRQCGAIVMVLALRSGDPGFKTRSDHLLNLFLVVTSSTSRLHLGIANWVASGQLLLMCFEAEKLLW